MKVLVLSPKVGFPPTPGGAAGFVRGVCLGLQRRGHEVRVHTDANSGAEDFDRGEPYEVSRVRLPRNSVAGAFQAAKAVFGEGYQWRPDVVFIGHLSLQYDLGALLLRWLLGVPYAVLVHGLDSQMLLRSSRKVRFLTRAILRNASLVLANSSYTKERVLKDAQARAVAILRPGVDTERFHSHLDGIGMRRRLRLDEGARVILTVGRLVERKGHAAVIHALPQVLEAVPEAKYVVVGGGPAEEGLRALVQELGLEGQVIFAGYLEEEALPQAYGACDVFVMPSLELPASGNYEGFGMVFLEASACGKPVVGTRSGGVPEAIRDGDSGLLVEVGDIEGLAQAMVRLLSDGDYARRLGEQGSLWVEQEMSWERTLDALEGYLEEVV